MVCKIDTISQVFGSKVYYYFGKKREKVSLDVQFIGGYQALTNYFDSLYFNREAYDNSKYDYDGLIKRILFSTEGKWMKSTKNNHKDKYFLKFDVLKLR